MTILGKKIDRLTLLNWSLLVVTLIVALIYIGVSVRTALNKPHGDSGFNDVLFGSPRGGIVVCWAIAAGALLFLPEIGKLINALSLAGVVTFFVLWWDKTNNIRNIVGVDYQADNWVQNYFFGGGYLDLLALGSAIALLVLDVVVIKRNLRSFAASRDHRKVAPAR